MSVVLAVSSVCEVGSKMRHTLIIFGLLLAAYLVASSPIDYKRRLVNRPSLKDVFARIRRSDQYLKGSVGRASGTKLKQPLEYTLRKGEYICGNKVCKLKPGEKPPCPVCQYPL